MEFFSGGVIKFFRLIRFIPLDSIARRGVNRVRLKFLQHIVIRVVNRISLLNDMDRWLNIGINGGACWPKEETVVKFGGHELVLKPATKDTEQSVHINLHGKISDVDAMTLIHRFLSILSWCDDQGMEFMDGGGVGSPIPIAVSKRIRIVGSSIAFPFYRDMDENPKVKLALALYREGLTVKSIPFSFLSYYKIIEIFYKKSQIKNINEILSKIKDDLALERLKKLEKMEKDIPTHLYESCRCAIAHAYTKRIVDPDDVADLRDLSQDIWIVKAIAAYLIEYKLGISRSICG